MDFNRKVVTTKDFRVWVPSTGKQGGYFPISIARGCEIAASNAPLQTCFLEDGSVVPGVLVRMPEKADFPFTVPLKAIRIDI